MSKAPITIVEVEPFHRHAREVWSEEEVEEFKDFLARAPEAGDIVPGAGGVRKVRWAASGRGKRGGARVIYYYHSDELPLFLLTAYAKNVQADLTMGQKQAMAKLVKLLIDTYRSTRS